MTSFEQAMESSLSRTTLDSLTNSRIPQDVVAFVRQTCDALGHDDIMLDDDEVERLAKARGDFALEALRGLRLNTGATKEKKNYFDTIGTGGPWRSVLMKLPPELNVVMRWEARALKKGVRDLRPLEEDYQLWSLIAFHRGTVIVENGHPFREQWAAELIKHAQVEREKKSREIVPPDVMQHDKHAAQDALWAHHRRLHSDHGDAMRQSRENRRAIDEKVVQKAIQEPLDSIQMDTTLIRSRLVGAESRLTYGESTLRQLQKSAETAENRAEQAEKRAEEAVALAQRLAERVDALERGKRSRG